MLHTRQVLQDKTNGEGNELPGVSSSLIESGKTQVSEILNESVSQVLEKILNGTYILQKNDDKYNQREVNKITGEYIHTFLLGNGFTFKVRYQADTMEMIKVEYQGKIEEISGEKLNQLKGKLKKIYTIPAFHSNPDGSPRGAWL